MKTRAIACVTARQYAATGCATELKLRLPARLIARPDAGIICAPMGRIMLIAPMIVAGHGRFAEMEYARARTKIAIIAVIAGLAQVPMRSAAMGYAVAANTAETAPETAEPAGGGIPQVLAHIHIRHIILPLHPQHGAETEDALLGLERPPVAARATAVTGGAETAVAKVRRLTEIAGATAVTKPPRQA